jgi:Na+-translocating ferredoxin:NAD+ oxidoreductase RnfG subunit
VRTDRIKFLYPVVLVALVFAISVSLLVFTDGFTRENLELQKDQQTVEMLKQVFPEASYYDFNQETEIYTVYNSRGNEIGYAFYARGWSYLSEGAAAAMQVASKIEILVGLEDKGTLSGIYSFSYGGDAYYWEKLIKEDYFNEFIGLKVEDVNLDKYGGEVDNVTGATLSCKSVVDIVRITVLSKIKYIE